MVTLPESLVETLRQARQNKALSQRELSERTGVPQSHISKIEQGAVDLRISSLRSIANALDLEIALVPRKSMPAVRMLTQINMPRPRTNPVSENFEKRLADHKANMLQAVDERRQLIDKSSVGNNAPRPAYRLDDDDDA